MSRLQLVLFACLLLAPACSTETQLPVRPLTPYEKQLAVERGRVFRAPLASLRANQDYRLERLTPAQLPRIHAAADVSLFVMSGRAQITVDGVRHHLRTGQSLDVPQGTWYLAESVDDAGSSVFFVFSAAERSWASSPRRVHPVGALHSRHP